MRGQPKLVHGLQRLAVLHIQVSRGNGTLLRRLRSLSSIFSAMEGQ
jgi:hypothetical protein